MGGAVSTGEDNDDLVDNLVEHACITSSHVEHVFRAVDRAHYFTEECRDSAYKDTAWRSDNLHLSAPCIYSSVMENLDLKPGSSFLNIGSGTGYVSTMAGLIIGSRGVNHGVELFQDVIDYAYQRLAEFTAHSNAVDQFDFCPPQFVSGNGLLIAAGRQYDRVYCGARCPLSELPYLKQLLKMGGVLVVPVNDHLKRIERLGDDQWDVQDKLSVSFAGLIEPRVSGHKTELTMPPLVPASLQQLCRTRIRCLLRARLLAARPQLVPPPRQQGSRRRRPPGRRAQQARRIQRLVMPLLDAAVAEAEADGDEPADEQERRRQDELGHLGQVVYGAVARMAGRSDHEDDQEEEDHEDGEDGRAEHTDHSEETYMELDVAAEPGSVDQQQQQEETANRSGEQENAADRSTQQETPDRAAQQETPDHAAQQETPDRAAQQETPDHAAQQETPDHAAQQETSDHAAQQETTDHAAQQKTPYHAAQQETPDHAAQQETPDHAAQQETPDHAAQLETPDHAAKQETSDHAAQQETPDRASLKRSSEESGAGAGGEPATGAGPSDTQKRGRRDKFDSGLGDSPPPPPPPPPALLPRDHSEPENGVAASSDDDDDGDDDGEGDGRRSLLLLPPPSRWGGRSARVRAGLASELSRFLAAGSDEDELDDLQPAEDESEPPRGRCVLGVQGRRRCGRRSPRPSAATGHFLAEQMRARIAALPLPPPLRQYVNLDRPLREPPGDM